MNLKSLSKQMSKWVTKHSPELLTGVGVVGLITAGVTAVKSTPKALRIIDERENELERDLSKKEVIQETWKCYAGPIVTAIASTACIIGGSKVHLKRNAALLTAYNLTEKTLTEYKKQISENVDSESFNKIKDKVAKKIIDEAPELSDELMELIPGRGDTLCFDTLSGSYFRSSKNQIEAVRNIVNSKLNDEMYVSLNEFYYELEMPAIKLGDILGWNIDDGHLDITYSAQVTKSGRPCLVVDYLVCPRTDYAHMM